MIGAGHRNGASSVPRAALVGCALLLVASAIGCGTPVRRERLVFEDEFDSARLDTTRWNTCHWWNPRRCTIASNGELEWYVPEQVNVTGGRLRMTADRSPGGRNNSAGRAFVSGMVTTGPTEERGVPKFAFTFGRIEVVFSTPVGTGLWPAVWLLPASTSSRPEIDVVEILGDDPATWIFHLHPKARDADSPSSRVSRENLARGFHTAGLDWERGRLR